jgi:hypothetical protein
VVVFLVVGVEEAGEECRLKNKREYEYKIPMMQSRILGLEWGGQVEREQSWENRWAEKERVGAIEEELVELRRVGAFPTQ